MDYWVEGDLAPAGAFFGEQTESFAHPPFDIAVSGARLSIGYDDPALQAGAVALGRRYTNELSVRSGAAISWSPTVFRAPAETGHTSAVSVTLSASVKAVASLGARVIRRDGSSEPLRTDKDLAPASARLQCLDAFPEILKALDYAAEYMRTRDVRHLSRLWDVVMAATGAAGDQSKFRAIETQVSQTRGWAADVGQSLHALRHEVAQPARLTEDECFARARVALLAAVEARCP